MSRIMNKEKFIKIFKVPEYRKKLDNIILDFFGLDAKIENDINSILESDIILEFILFVNTEYILKIKVKDTKKLFASSKKFYINLSFREVERYHQLLMPCYWEFYCPYSLKQIKNKPKIILIAALFACKNKEEMEIVLKKLNIFTKKEIEKILEIL